MKRQSLIILAVLLATLALASCGIPQEDYDQVVSDLAAAQAEITRLETDLAAARNENGSLQNELDAAVAEYEGLQTEYDDLNGKHCDNSDGEQSSKGVGVIAGDFEPAGDNDDVEAEHGEASQEAPLMGDYGEDEIVVPFGQEVVFYKGSFSEAVSG